MKNLQGDVIRIIDLAGIEVADAWGNIKDTKGEPKIREINPIRYRSYVSNLIQKGKLAINRLLNIYRHDHI